MSILEYTATTNMEYEGLYDELGGLSESGWSDLEGLMKLLPEPATFTQSTDKLKKVRLNSLITDLVYHIEEVEGFMNAVSECGSDLIKQQGGE